jgi:predicted amidohydrolase YtcJ
MRKIMKRVQTGIAALSLLSALLGGCGSDEPAKEAASLVVTGARVWTGDPEMPWAEALAADGERIAAVGGDEDIAALVGPDTQLVEARGAMLLPGFIDTHVHFATGGSSLASVQLRDAQTTDVFVQRIADHAATLEPGEWILDGAWDHEHWGGELPTRDWIDSVTPDNPVWIYRLDGHMALANSIALELAGVDADTPDVEGGEIVRDEDGRPTGILKDNAMALVTQAVPAPGEAQLDRQIRAAMDYVASHGVTTVHDMGDDFVSMAAYRRLHAAGELKTRIYSVVPLSSWEKLRDEVAENGRGDAWLRVGGLKGFMDGSLGSHTAAFFEPFTDAPEDSGFFVNELDDMREWITGADEAGLHIMVHAIGDRAIADLLDIYLDVAEAHGDRDRRFRIEHAQHIRPSDIPRFAEQDVIASMQPYHAIDDGRWADRVIGEKRSETTYAFRSLIDPGAHVAFGSDWFVAPAIPLEGIYAAVTRRTLDGANPDGWVPGQKITVEEALHAYTFEGAYASFEESEKGTLKPGMLADLVLVDRDLTGIPPEQIRDAKVLMTVVGGRVVYDSEEGHDL